MEALPLTVRNEAVARRERTDQWTAIAPLKAFWEPELFPAATEPETVPETLRLVVFNIERGVRLELIQAYLEQHPELKQADIILANELDDGMARSGNRAVTRELAEALGLHAAQAVEFLELVGDNDRAYHCNAIFSRYPLKDVSLLRLPLYYDWFNDEQKRLGTRVALFARLTIGGRDLVVGSLHLENVSSPLQRSEAMNLVHQHVCSRYGSSCPVVLGGDLNTNTVTGHDKTAFEDLLDPAVATKRLAEVKQREPLFEQLALLGYDVEDCNLPVKVTRRRHVAGQPDVELNLDWFFTRGLKVRHPGVVDTRFDPDALELCPAELLERRGEELSDHNTIYCEAEWPPAQTS